MDKLRPFRLPLTFLSAGLLVRIFGALIKIMHWPGGLEMLWAGTILMSAGIIIFLFRLWAIKKINP